MILSMTSQHQDQCHMKLLPETEALGKVQNMFAYPTTSNLDHKTPYTLSKCDIKKENNLCIRKNFVSNKGEINVGLGSLQDLFMSLEDRCSHPNDQYVVLDELRVIISCK